VEKRIILILRLAASLGVVVLFALLWQQRPSSPPFSKTARTTEEIRGIALGLFASDPDYDYAHLIEEIAQHGATDISLAFAWYQRDIFSRSLREHPQRSPKLKTIRRSIRQAKTKGLRVTLLPMVLLERTTAQAWRGRIAPAGGVIAWFASYQSYLHRIAKLAQDEGVIRMAVGSELLSLEAYPAAWIALVASIRPVFQGKLFYAANWDHLQKIDFAHALDEIGISAYPPLSDTPTLPNEGALSNRWKGFLRELLHHQARWQRPVFLAEVGYPALPSAARYPWDETQEGDPAPFLQARLWRIFCDAYHNLPKPSHAQSQRIAPSSNLSTLRGFFAWNWFGFGGFSDTTFSPRGKPASAVIRYCLAPRLFPAPPL
jgi:hypothetical protein